MTGRDEEVRALRRHLADTASGTPVNVALVGERAAGKTSLLNKAQSIAQEERLLPVRLDLDENLTRTPHAFFKAVFDAAVRALVQGKVLRAEDDRVIAWERASYAGLPVQKPQLLKFEWLANLANSTSSLADVPPPLVQDDMSTICDLAKSSGWKGVSLLIDEGDLLAVQGPLMQRLRNLFQVNVGWNVIIAGTAFMFEEISDVFSPIPRQFVRIEVGPYHSASQVLQCIMRPIRGYETTMRQFGLSPMEDSVEDIAALTGSRPYEINLVCYHIWEQLRDGALMSFAPSLEVLDRVLTELRQFGRTYAEETEIELIRGLSADDLETAVDFFSYTGLTLDEVALTRLWPRIYTPQELANERDRAERSFRYLEGRGLLANRNGRVTSALSTGASVYFRYASQVHARQHVQHRIQFRHSYPQLITENLVQPLRSHLSGRPITPFDARIKEMIDPSVGRSLRHLQVGLNDGDYDEVASARVLRYARLPSLRAGEKLLFVGVITAIEVFRVEVGFLLLSSDYSDVDELQAAVHSYLDERQELAGLYGVQFDDVVVAMATEEDSDLLVMLHRIFEHEYTNRAYDYYSARDFVGGYEHLKAGHEAISRYLERGHKLKERLQEEYADLLNKLGFFALVLGEYDVADQAQRLALKNRFAQPWIAYHNLAHSSAVRGDYERAAVLERDAIRNLPKTGLFSAILCYFLPPTVGSRFSDKYGNIINGEGDVQRYLLELQQFVYERLGGVTAVDLPVLPESVVFTPLAIRFVAWVEFLILRNREAALEWIERAASMAVDESDLDIDWEELGIEEVELPEEVRTSATLLDVLWHDRAVFEGSQLRLDVFDGDEGSAQPE